MGWSSARIQDERRRATRARGRESRSAVLSSIRVPTFTRALGLAMALGAASGCVLRLPAPEPVPPERSGSLLAPIERLGRFDGERFHPLEPGSLAASHVYVLVHGWEPGWAPAARAFPRLRSWQLTHGGDPPFEPWVSELGRAILRADANAVVLAYSWFDDAATGAFPLEQRHAFAHTELHGRWLAEALERALEGDVRAHRGRVHLLGHSYGARVVALAALDLARPPDHVTFFDAPDAPMTQLFGTRLRLDEILRRLPIGGGRDRVFVDNYVASWVGRTYHQLPGLSAVVDVVLAAPHGELDQRGRHAYPMTFYAQTVGRDVGLGWGPLTTGHHPAPGCFRQVAGRVALARGCPSLP
jgi:hypothetical protein